MTEGCSSARLHNEFVSSSRIWSFHVYYHQQRRSFVKNVCRRWRGSSHKYRRAVECLILTKKSWIKVNGEDVCLQTWLVPGKFLYCWNIYFEKKLTVCWLYSHFPLYTLPLHENFSDCIVFATLMRRIFNKMLMRNEGNKQQSREWLCENNIFNYIELLMCN